MTATTTKTGHGTRIRLDADGPDDHDLPFELIAAHGPCPGGPCPSVGQAAASTPSSHARLTSAGGAVPPAAVSDVATPAPAGAPPTTRVRSRHQAPLREVRVFSDGLQQVLQQFDFALRLLLAAILGGAIGVEREIHDHPAGIRTHMLVSLGAAIFTLLGIVGFEEVQSAPGVVVPVDPTRIAAQVVSGIGFLGAGAIIKYGTTVRGLTTAASLWATASIGMAAAAGAWLIASVGTVIMIASLWPLARIVARVRPADGRALRLQLGLHDLPTSIPSWPRSTDAGWTSPRWRRRRSARASTRCCSSSRCRPAPSGPR